VIDRCRVVASVAGALFLFGSCTASAQGNDRLLPTGGRSTLMGGTGVALGRDGAAPFLNPATIAAIEDEHLAFSANFFTYSLRHISQWNQPGPVDASKFGAVELESTDDSSTRFHGLPATLCLFFTLSSRAARTATETDTDEDESAHQRGRQKLAVCLGGLEGDDVNLTALSFHGSTAAGTTSQIESIARSWNRLYAGPSYAIDLTDRLALGLSAWGVVTSDSFVLEGSSVTSLLGGTAMQSALGTSGYGYSFDLAAEAGATYRLGRATLGASAELPSVHVLGPFQATAHDDASGQTDTAHVMQGRGSFQARPPVRFAVGAGFAWPRLIFEVDESCDLPSSTAIESTMNVVTTTLSGTAASVSSTNVTYAVRTRAMLNTSVGAEYFVRRGLSLIGGASTNLTTLRGLDPQPSVGNLIQSRTNHVGISFGLGSYGAAADLLMGVQLDYGWGQALAVNPYVVPNEWAVVGTQTYSATLVLAGSTSLRAIGRALDKVKDVVTQPAPPAPSARAAP
jgi:hypothetical protein